VGKSLGVAEPDADGVAVAVDKSVGKLLGAADVDGE